MIQIILKKKINTIMKNLKFKDYNTNKKLMN